MRLARRKRREKEDREREERERGSRERGERNRGERGRTRKHERKRKLSGRNGKNRYVLIVRLYRYSKKEDIWFDVHVPHYLPSVSIKEVLVCERFPAL